MFPCGECDRTYASRNSLARHRHNHRKTKQHVCSICNVIFYRRDLLSRHLKLHEKEGDSGKIERAVRGQGVRRRCHTACLRCRELRTKCSGQQPCASCINSGSRCEYSAPNNRVSHQMRPESQVALEDSDDDQDDHRDETEDEDEDEINPHNSDTTALEIHATSSDFPHLHQSSTQAPTTVSARDVYRGSQPQSATDSNPSPSHNFHVGGNGMTHTADSNFGSNAHQSTFTLDAGNQYSSAINHEPHSQDVLMDLDPFFANTVSWPFLHESLFLSDPPVTSGRLDYSDFEFNRQIMLGNAADHLPTQADLFGLGEPNDNAQLPVDLEHDLPAPATHFMGDTGGIMMNEPLSNQSRELRTSGAAVNSQMPATFSPNQQQSDDASSNQTQVVNQLVAYASSYATSSNSRPEPSAYWISMSPRVAVAFKLGSRPGQLGLSTLRSFVNLYFKHFGPLWPLISLQSLELDNMHPLLYLVLTSIGAMYGGPAASNYGVLMHSRVRIPLTMAIEMDDGEDNLLWLAQARLLTQVGALYFGQPKAFSYSQHLGALLVSQARRMDLFSSTPAENAMRQFRVSKDSMPDADRLDIWLQLEARRRLAFGIFRGAIYLSVLLHTRPLVLMEEIDLRFPSCDVVWRNGPMAPRVCLQMIEHSRSPSAEMRASDVYRIAMDRHEPLPPLDPASHELLLFGLQWPLWQFSRDQKMFHRLTGQGITSFDSQGAIESASYGCVGFDIARASTPYSEAESLDQQSRQMPDLRTECSRFTMALQKWERALPLVKTFVQTDMDRSSLLSSLILYHLGYVRLNAPIENLHQIQYRLADNRSLNEDLVEEAKQWANSAAGRLAAERACTIWSLITREAVVTNRRAKFNLLAFTALHHCTVLLWTFAGAHKSTDEASSPGLLLKPLADTESSIMVSRFDCSRMLASFVQLYDLISPARWSSFARAVDVLKRQEFPSGW